MIIGVPKEIKEHEYRVSMTPQNVRELVAEGHRLLVERSAGDGSGFPDAEYIGAGAELLERGALFSTAELIAKVKEPIADEYDLLRHGQTVFTYLHLASNPGLTEVFLKKNITGFAYETLEVDGTTPLLQPMSEVAGEMAPVMAAYYLQKIHGGEGVLITGAGGVPPANVLILGAGIVGMSALKVAYGMGAKVTVINRGMEKLKMIDELYQGRVRTIASTRENIETEAVQADILIGAVYVIGARTPVLVSRDLVSRMKKGAVIVDVSVDQGGCIETTRPTTHSNPVYTEEGVIHYSVANMPGAYPRTSTLALTKQTFQYIRMLAASGVMNAVKEGHPMRTALNTYQGRIVHKAVAGSLS